jgi:RNA polymerase sigma-70 factor (ECF subfamily)
MSHSRQAHDHDESDDGSDAELVILARRDRSAFVALYRRYLARVYRYVYQRVGNQQDAEDVTASVFTQALEGLEDYREQGTFAGWLFTIAHHRVADHHRQRRERISLEEVAPTLSDSGPGPEARVLRRDRLERVAQALDELTPDRQEALALRFFGELSNKEVAQVTGKSKAAVKMLVYRAIRQLRRRCRDEG